MSLTPRQLAVLVVLTLIWGINWPILKVGVTGFPPLTFRALSMWLGLPVLDAALLLLKVPFAIPRAHWRELSSLTLSNMIVWHVLAIVRSKPCRRGVPQSSATRCRCSRRCAAPRCTANALRCDSLPA